MNAPEMLECAGCGSRYVTPLAAAVCCEDWDCAPAYERNYEIGNN